MKEKIQFSPVDVFSYADYWRKHVDPRLEQYFRREQENPFCEKDYGREVLEQIADLTLRGGKRQRVAFVAATTSLLGGELDDRMKTAVIDAAMAVEILQTQLLIHDDIIDEAPLRRGGKTIHTYFSEIFQERAYRGDQRRYGDAVALLAGDLVAYFACYPVISSEAIPDEQKIRIIDILLRSGIDTFYGQLLDLLRDARGMTSEDEILKLAFIKAGRSSGEAPMHIGAVLAGKDDPDVFQKLSAYAVPISIAAQLQDDILGVFGNEKKLGKSILSDLSEGKQTLLILEAKNRADASQQAVLNKFVGKRDLTLAEADQVKGVILETGALEYVKEKAKNFAHKAQIALQDWGPDWGVAEKNFFWTVTMAAIKREY